MAPCLLVRDVYLVYMPWSKQDYGRNVLAAIAIARQLTLVRASKALRMGESPRAEDQAHRPGRCTRGMSCTRAFYYVVQYRTLMRAIILKCSAA